MFYKYLFVLGLSTTYLFGNTIVDSKIIDGTLYKIIESDAKVMPSFDGNGNSLNGVSLVFKNTLGKTAVSRKTHTTIPKHKDNNIKIFYVEKGEDQDKQIYEVFFDKDDIHLLPHGVKIDNYTYEHISIISIIFIIFIGLIFSGRRNEGEVDGTYKSD